MAKESNEFQCDLNCPLRPRGGIPYCCGTCEKTKFSYITDDNRHLWTDDKGFSSPQGCRLPRENVPDECKVYDCRKYKFMAVLDFIDGKWQPIAGFELRNDLELEVVTKSIIMTMKANKWSG